MTTQAQHDGKQLLDNSVAGGKIKDQPQGLPNIKLNDDAVDERVLDLSKTYDFETLPGGGGDIRVRTDPLDPKSVVNKAYVDATASGLDIKDSCALVGTAADGNITIDGSAGLPTIDGQVVVDGQRVLLTAQTALDENGIWIAHDVGTPWERPTDFPVGGSASGAFTFITEGSNWEATGWVCRNDVGSDVIGDQGTPGDDLYFVQFSGAGLIDAGLGLTKTGNQLNVGMKLGTGAGSPGGAITANADDIQWRPDDSTLEITDVAGDVGRARIKAAGVGTTELSSAVAGDGLTGGSGSPLSVQPDGAPIAPAVNVLQVAAGGVSVNVDGISVVESGGKLAATREVANNKNEAPAATSGDYQDTGLVIAKTPAADGSGLRVVRVFVNGLEVKVANNDRDLGACYFAEPGTSGAAARHWNAIQAADELWWNGSATRAGYDLAITDRVTMAYQVAE